ncbi:MAG: OmpA family protein [Hyphomonadaceae bacterium]|nr:OmpA family protein [Hyphomonadaceae bacterium]
MSDKSRRRLRRLGAGVGVGAGVCGALLALGLMSVGGMRGGPSGDPSWVREIVAGLAERGYDWIAIDLDGRVATVSGAAPDVDSLKYGFEAAETALQRGDHAADVGLVVDATALEGGPAGVGAALAALGPAPEASACQDAFSATLEGRSINFEPGRADLTDDNRRLLDALAAVAIRCGAYKVEVGGHTDATGDVTTKNVLSQARADAVRAYLVGKGVAAEQLDAQGYGARNPRDAGRGPAADARNRRIEFTVSAS